MASPRREAVPAALNGGLGARLEASDDPWRSSEPAPRGCAARPGARGTSRRAAAGKRSRADADRCRCVRAICSCTAWAGLSRSAMNQAAALEQRWAQRICKPVSLGTPHPPAPPGASGWICCFRFWATRHHSAPGQAVHRGPHRTAPRQCSPDVEHSAQGYLHPAAAARRSEASAVAGVVADREEGVKTRLLSDGPEPPASARGEYCDPAFHLALDDAHRKVARTPAIADVASVERADGVWLAATLTTASRSSVFCRRLCIKIGSGGHGRVEHKPQGVGESSHA
jgi:hypothetical protein